MANAYLDIYHPEGWVMMQPLITKEAERVEELMQADYAQLSWADTERMEIPAGAFIYDPDTGEQLTLLDPYEPEQKDELEYDYKPIFQSRVMAWGKVPFFHFTYDANGNITAREPDWVLTDNPANFLQAICDAIRNGTGDEWSFEVAGDVIGNSATISFSATDIFSALNQIASEFDTEWLADKTSNTLRLGKAMYDFGYYSQLIVGDNVGAPSVTASKEGYYNRFYCFGSTRNITQDYKGASVNNLVNRRLTLSSADYPDGYIDTPREDGTPVFPKILIFDDIYPRSGFTVSDLRPRLMYRLNPDDNNSKIQIGTDDAGNPVYDMYTIWYFQIDGFKLNDTTYSKDNPDGMLISGKNLSVHFSSGALTGREFELIYHPSAKRLSNSDGQDFNVKAGDYEIKFIEESGFILPAQVGIVPADGDEIILFNLRMPEEYIASSQQELAEAAYAEIDSKYTTDLNNYTLSSNPVAFDANGTILPIGQMVDYHNGDYCYTTRVIKVTRKLDFACEQEMVIGNTKIKGNTATLKEEVVNANSNIDVLTQLNQLNQQVTQAYQRTTQMILDSMGKAAQFWTEHPTLPNTIITKYNVIGEQEIVAKADGDGSGSGSGDGRASHLYELLDVELNNPAQGQVLTYDRAACNGNGGWVARTIQQGLDEGALLTYLTNNNYAKRSDIPDVSRFVTLDYLNLQGYLTEHQDISHLLPRVEFDDMLERVERADGTWYIRAKADFVGEGEITANAKGSGGESSGIVSGNATSIGGYEVVLNTLRDGDVLVWNGSKWVNRAVASGGIDESSLAAYLQRNQYVTAGDLAGYAPLSALDKYLYHRRDGSIDIDSDITDNAGGLYEIYSPAGTLPPFNSPNKWVKVFDWGTDDPNYRVQLATGYTDNAGLYLRHKMGGHGWYGWREILDSDNYAAHLDSHYVNAAGDTMTGELHFSNNGSLVFARYDGTNYSNILFVDSRYKQANFGSPHWERVCMETSSNWVYRETSGSYYKIWDEGNDGDLMRNREHNYMSDILQWNGAPNLFISTWYPTDANIPYPYGAAINFRVAGAWHYRLTFDTDNPRVRLYQGINTTTLHHCGDLAFTSDNVASASKLQTARNIFLDSCEDYSRTSVAFDGSGDVLLRLPSTIITSDWFRSRGMSGWYNETYYGGIYMTDSTWVRVFNQKAFFCESTIRSDGAFVRDSYGGSSWNNGYGAYNVGIADNGNQTPLLLAYRMGYGAAPTGAPRLFAMELLNDGTTLNIGFGGVHRFEFTADGNFRALNEVTATNGSDIRLKTNVRRMVGAVEMLRGLGGYFAYDYLDWAGESDRTGRIGLIYQNMGGDMLRLMGGERTVDGVTYGALNYIKSDYINLIGASVLETAARVDDHEARLQALEQQSGNQKLKTKN